MEAHLPEVPVSGYFALAQFPLFRGWTRKATELQSHTFEELVRDLIWWNPADAKCLLCRRDRLLEDLAAASCLEVFQHASRGAMTSVRSQESACSLAVCVQDGMRKLEPRGGPNARGADRHSPAQEPLLAPKPGLDFGWNAESGLRGLVPGQVETAEV